MSGAQDIFLSYKKEDVDRARLLVDALKLQGWTVWWDPEIRTGENWSPAIEAAITGARCIVVAWSELSVKSAWVFKEARQGEMRHILMPVMFDKVAPPFEFEHLQGTNLVGWKGSPKDKHFLGLVEQIEGLLGKEAEQQKEAAGHRVRRIVRYRAHIVAAAVAFLSLGGVGSYLSTSVSEAREVRLVDVDAEEAGFILAPPALNQSTATDVTSVTATLLVSLTEVTILWAGGSVYVPSGVGADGAHISAQEYSADLLRIGPPGPDGSLELAPLELSVGSGLTLGRTPGAAGYTMTMAGHAATGRTEIELRVRGVVTVTIPGRVQGTVDFGRGSVIVVRAGEGPVAVEFVPATKSELVLIENLSVSQLEISRVDEVVELGASRATRVSTTVSGTLRGPGFERGLGPAETVRFGSFDGVVGRLSVGGGRIHFEASGRVVTGIEAGSDNVYASLMPPRWRALDDGMRALLLVGAVLWLAALLLLIPRFWRAPS